MPELPVLVIGGGPGGMEAARGIADIGYRCVLVEKRMVLGGTPELANYAALTPDFRDAGEAMAEMAKAVQDDEQVDVRIGTTVRDVSGAAGGFEVDRRVGRVGGSGRSAGITESDLDLAHRPGVGWGRRRRCGVQERNRFKRVMNKGRVRNWLL